jgi:hypothetical protein
MAKLEDEPLIVFKIISCFLDSEFEYYIRQVPEKLPAYMPMQPSNKCLRGYWPPSGKFALACVGNPLKKFLGDCQRILATV